MNKQIIYWLDWKNKTIKPNKKELQEISWKDIENFPITAYCSQNEWPLIEIEEKEKKIITDEEKRTYQVGLATIKELRGGTEANPEGLGTQALKKMFELCPDFVSEHPSHSKEIYEALSGWVFPPRFENLQQGAFENVSNIDIKGCHGNIMREYPLPYGEPIHIKDPKLIEEKLKEDKNGFVRFYLKNGARIKNNQIPFIPDYNNEIKSEIKGRLLLYTRLFRTFKNQYQIIKPIIFTDFWIFEEKKGCVNNFLDYCEKLKTSPETEREGKMLINSFSGAIGKSQRRGYNYRVWTIAIKELAVLQVHYLCRLFKPENVLAIRSDEICVQGELPDTLLKESHKYHIKKVNKVGFEGKDNIFNYDKMELKSFAPNNQIREKIIKKFQN